MQVLVDLHLAVFGLLGALAIACVMIHFALRGGSGLIWLGAAIACVCTETLVFRYAAQTGWGLAAISLLIPLAYLCAGNAIRQSVHLPIVGSRQVWIVFSLIGLSLLLLAADAPAFYQGIPFQLAGIYTFFDVIRVLARQQRRSLLDNALLVLCVGAMIGAVIRAPMFPLLLGRSTPFPTMSVSTFEGVFLNTLGGLTTGLFLLVTAKIVANVIELHRHRADHDSLTGLLNRRTFNEMVEKVRGSAGSVVMCDIDRFKAVNDSYGHHVGDDVIQGFARILSAFGGHIGRLGGEEFSLLLADTPPQEAALIADAIRRDFERFRHEAMGEHTALSASFGVSGFGEGRCVKTALQEADKALYRAKGAGRNRVCYEQATSSCALEFDRVA